MSAPIPDADQAENPLSHVLKNRYMAYHPTGPASIRATGCTPDPRKSGHTLLFKRILLDTRSPCNFIKRSIALASGLPIRKAETAIALVDHDGPPIEHDEYVMLPLTLSGPLEVKIMAYVDDGDDELQLLVGRQGLGQFNFKVHAERSSTGVPYAMKTVRAHDMRTEYVVAECPSWQKPTMTSDGGGYSVKIRALKQGKSVDEFDDYAAREREAIEEHCRQMQRTATCWLYPLVCGNCTEQVRDP